MICKYHVVLLFSREGRPLFHPVCQYIIEYCPGAVSSGSAKGSSLSSLRRTDGASVNCFIIISSHCTCTSHAVLSVSRCTDQLESVTCHCPSQAHTHWI